MNKEYNFDENIEKKMEDNNILGDEVLMSQDEISFKEIIKFIALTVKIFLQPFKFIILIVF